MKTTNCIIASALLSFSATKVHADITFTAPGFTSPYVTTELEKHVHHDMGEYWKYIVTGYEYRLYAGVPNGGKVTGNSLRYKTGETSFPGQTTVEAKINRQVILKDTLNTNVISGTTGLVSHSFSSPIIIQNQDITTCLQYSTNMIGGNELNLLAFEFVFSVIDNIIGFGCKADTKWRFVSSGYISEDIWIFNHFDD